MAGKDYANETIVVHWDATRCIHTGLCTAGLPGVFDVKRRPWISLAGADPDAVAEVVDRCPTGALRSKRLDRATPERHDDATTVVPVPDGPLYLRGNLRILDESGAEITQEARVALCRCGGTGNPPFCDNTHLRLGYRSGNRAP